jgi:hypothetical protein
MDARTRQLVQRRAGGRCEYCRLPEAADEWTFHVDHIVARVHGGGDEPENLAWSYTQCNLHKAGHFASIDPESRARVDLFNPRQDDWSSHFQIGIDGLIAGQTAAGRATVRLLDMNGTPQLDLRRELIQLGEYPDG